MTNVQGVFDSDAHFIINTKTRIIKDSNSIKTKLAQGDHNSERLSFEMDRYIDGYDMSKCTIRIHYNNISENKQDTSKDIYIVNDVQVSPEDENTIIFSWLVSGNATKYNGVLGFSISFEYLEDIYVVYKWNTFIYSKITVGSTYDNSENIIELYSDVLAQWKLEIKDGLSNDIAESFDSFSDEVNDKITEKLDNFSTVKDWNVDDENDPRYIHNRPFYVGSKIDLASYDAYYGQTPNGHVVWFTSYWAQESVLASVKNGKKYKVIVNGVEFDGIGYESDDVYEGKKNNYIMIDNDENFKISLWPECSIPINKFISIYGHVPNTASVITIKIEEIVREHKNIDPKFLPKTYVVDSENYRYGDECLQAILDGRQVLVKVPNKDGGTNYTNFMPVIQYQLPNENNDYLTLFYLKDGIATNLLIAMNNMSNGTPMDYVFADVYGEITMQLTKTYKECPLKADKPFN